MTQQSLKDKTVMSTMFTINHLIVETMNGLRIIKSGKLIKKQSNKIMPRKKEPKTSKGETISTRSMKVWITPLYQRIKKQPNLRLSKKFRWASISQKHGITLHIPAIITMETVFTFVNFVCPFLTYQSSSNVILKSVLYSTHLEIRCTEMNKPKWRCFKLMA